MVLAAKGGSAACGSVRLPPAEELGLGLCFIGGLGWSAESLDDQQPSNVWLSHARRHSASSGGTFFPTSRHSQFSTSIIIRYGSVLAFIVLGINLVLRTLPTGRARQAASTKFKTIVDAARFLERTPLMYLLEYLDDLFYNVFPLSMVL